MQLVPKAFQHKKVQVQVLNFATAASGVGVAAATGLRHVPVYWTLSASAAGSAAVYAGTGGSELIRIKFGAGDLKQGYYWDNESTANKLLLLEVEGAVGVGQFSVWYVIKRTGAGSDGLGQ